MGSKRRLVSQPQGDLLAGFGQNIRLILRLIADRRVSPLLKLLPMASLVYLFSPFDMAVPFIDDALILWLGNSLFLELCPQELVEEHRASLEPVRKSKKTAEPITDEDIIDARYKDK